MVLTCNKKKAIKVSSIFAKFFEDLIFEKKKKLKIYHNRSIDSN